MYPNPACRRNTGSRSAAANTAETDISRSRSLLVLRQASAAWTVARDAVLPCAAWQGDNNATVWQLIAADKDETIHLLRRNDETLVLLNERLEKSSPEIRLHLTSEGPALHAQ